MASGASEGGLTMAEYIEREALLQDIEDSVRFTVKTGTISPEMRGVNKIIDRIKCAPVADVVPVRHGRWKLVGADRRGRGGEWKCDGRDGCGKLYPHKCYYCPNCGAKMDEVSE